jgi:excisionase family DNA binding protein
MDTVDNSDWMTPAEAAAYLKVKPRSLLLWARQGKLGAYALSGTKRRVWRFRKKDLDSALLSKSVITCEPLTVLSQHKEGVI